MKRVSSADAHADYRKKLPAGTVVPAEVLALSEGPCRITPGRVRILLGPCAPFPDDSPPHSHVVGPGQSPLKRAGVVREEDLPGVIRALVNDGVATIVRFPALAIPCTNLETRAMESAHIWPIKPAQPSAPPASSLMAEQGEAEALRLAGLAVQAARLGRSRGFRGCGAVVYDPAYRCVRAWAYDRTQWFGIPEPAASSSSAAAAKGVAGAEGPLPPGMPSLPVASGPEDTHPLHSAPLLAIESIAVADRERRGALDRQREARAGLHLNTPTASASDASRRTAAEAGGDAPADPAESPSAEAAPSPAGRGAVGGTTPGPSPRAMKRQRDGASRGGADDQGGPVPRRLRDLEWSQTDARPTSPAESTSSGTPLPPAVSRYLYNVPPVPLPASLPAPSEAHEDQYICTGYDVFLSVEPSALDAMALLHARVRSVTFCAADPADGALLSTLRLHEARPLNHHYAAFQLKPSHALAAEAASLWSDGGQPGRGDPFASV